MTKPGENLVSRAPRGEAGSARRPLNRRLLVLFLTIALLLIATTPSLGWHRGHGRVFIDVGPFWWGPYPPPPYYVYAPPPVIVSRRLFTSSSRRHRHRLRKGTGITA